MAQSLLVAAGAALALLGVGALLWIMAKARAMRESDDDDATVRAELRTLAAVNGAAMGSSFLGLGLVLVGLLLD